MATTENRTPQWQIYLSKSSIKLSDSHLRMAPASKHDRILNNNDMDEGTRPPKRRKFNLESYSKSRETPTFQRQIVPYYPHNLRQPVVLPTVRAIESALRIDMKQFSIEKIRQGPVIELNPLKTNIVQCRCSLTLCGYNTGAHHKQVVCHLTKSLPLQISSDGPNDQSIEFASSDAFFDVSSDLLGTYRWTPEERFYTLADQYSIEISIVPQDNLECWPIVNISPLTSYGPITRAIKYGCASRMDVTLNCKTVIKVENQKLLSSISMSCGSLSCGDNAKGCHGEEQNTRHTLEIHTSWARSLVSSKAKGKPFKDYVERWARKKAVPGVISFRNNAPKTPKTISISTASSSSWPDSGHSTPITSEDSRQFNGELEVKNPFPVPSAGEKAPSRASPVEVCRSDPSINTRISDTDGASIIQITPTISRQLRNRPHVSPLPVRNRVKHKIPHTSKPLFHTITKQRLYPGDDLPDTDEETEEHWLNHKHQDIVGDYTDLNDFEKEYIKKWNVFITTEQHTVPTFLSHAMKRFVDANNRWIGEKGPRQREWTKHCMYLIMRGIMTEQEFSTCLDILDHSRVGISRTPKLIIPSVRDRGNLDCVLECF